MGLLKSIKSKIAIPLIFGGLLSITGCANLPTPVKIVATPVAVARDVIDIPLSTYASLTTKYDGPRDPRRKASASDKSSDNAGIIGFTGYLVGMADYVVCRSFVGSVKGKSPYRGARPPSYLEMMGLDFDSPWGMSGPHFLPDVETRGFYFPNTRSLWDEDYKNKFNLQEN